MFAILGLAALLAVILSFLGVSYPALVAARMQPAVAMRTDQV
jgi:ABC-type antimicrobial peptide transport system permease subunit